MHEKRRPTKNDTFETSVARNVNMRRTYYNFSMIVLESRQFLNVQGP